MSGARAMRTFGGIMLMTSGALALGSVVQLFVVPLQAKKRGKDPRIWFVFTLL